MHGGAPVAVWPAQSGTGYSDTFEPTQNDGRIQTRTDHISGETVEYQYDQLGRLTAAATTGSGGWGLAWNHDGFGNLTQQSVTKGTLTGFTLSINPATNRVNSQNYDANGNWLGSVGQSQTYDIENRVRTASGWQHQETYLYSARNERLVSKRDQDPHQVHFYGADGLLLGIYKLEIPDRAPADVYYPVRLPDQERIYFGGRLLQIGGEWVATDRLGSVVRKGSTNYKYAPYGQEIGGATANDTVKFATYTRDSLSGLDYALNRYYKPEWGRFTSPDPYQASGGPADPGSWNRYTYVAGDPVNFNDPPGLFASAITAGCQVSLAIVNITNVAVGLFGPTLNMAAPDMLMAEPAAEGGAARTGISFISAFWIASRAADKIATKNNWKSDCEQLLAKLGTSGAAISEAAGRVLFIEAPGSTITMASLYANSALSQVAIGQYGTETIASYIQRLPTKALAQLNGNRVYINQFYWGDSIYDDKSTVMHELVHNVTGLTDPDIDRALNADISKDAKPFSELLKHKCF